MKISQICAILNGIDLYTNLIESMEAERGNFPIADAFDDTIADTIADIVSQAWFGLPLTIYI